MVAQGGCGGWTDNVERGGFNGKDGVRGGGDGLWCLGWGIELQTEKEEEDGGL
ncbi:hypothetical protein Acr_05g0006010 [Actinidia rufa]|uniref:Uncharacterized protein n=1 Tax=Actinidia rufa TaxID=165716 RepID=A0A7J0EKY8_9ERIC|nr:hypothetical protein Acr_05g0006010 [Actinidia rufa]